MIYVGVPAHDAAAFGRGYWRTPAEMAIIYNVSYHRWVFRLMFLNLKHYDDFNIRQKITKRLVSIK